MTTNWDCHKCVWPEKVDSAYAVPPCTMHGQGDVFGDFGCNYYTTTALADEMIAAAATVTPYHSSSSDGRTATHHQDGDGGGGGSDDEEEWRPFAFDPPPPALQELSRQYWDAMSNGTGQPYSAFLPPQMMPKAVDYTRCAEATSNTFWVGTPFDEVSPTRQERERKEKRREDWERRRASLRQAGRQAGRQAALSIS